MRLAAPTPDHLLPAFYVAGVAAASGRPAEVMSAGYAMGSLSMTSYALDLNLDRQTSETASAARLLPERPAEQTNL